ncbi:MMPL family transporter [Streptomyces sp. NPDC087428]|uniref:MMPL family transporter n=1 Tax=Streptomyces sp. NPDC087428 TaxID=3365788 RepID=UPI0038208D10
MFRRIGTVVVRHPVWTIVAWLIATVAIVATAPGLPSNSGESSFLPKSYESIRAANIQDKAFPSSFTPSATALYQRSDGGRLTATDTKDVARITVELGKKKIDQVQRVVPGPPSEDGTYTMTLVQMDDKSAGQPEQADAAEVLRAEVKKLTEGTELDVKLGGPAAEALDQQDSSERGEALIGIGTIILVTLLIIFRAPILAILPLILIGLVSVVANGVIAYATKLFDLQANSSISSILVVVLFGVGTDYFLFLMFRYREHLRAGDEPKQAMINAVSRVGEAIACAAGAVIIAFLALVLSTLGFLRQMGPALAIAVTATLLAGLTLVPAAVSLIGPKVFWPSKSWKQEPQGARFAALGRGMQRRPALAAALSGLVLVALSLGAVDGVASARLSTVNKPGTTADFTVTLAYEASSDKAIDTVAEVRDVAHANAPEGTDAAVGGLSSIFKDIDTAVAHDYRTVFPVAALLIMIILGLLLRSVVAPWYLMASVGLGFGATLGATVWLFQTAQGHSGLLFMLPVIMYLFVVAIGTDYNILMIARLREEARAGRSPREAAGMALRHAGPTVAAAGFVLAAAFATMMLAGNALLTEMGFAVSFGIAIAAFVMAMFFTPSLTALIGHAAWWPGHGDRAAEPATGTSAGRGHVPGQAQDRLPEQGREKDQFADDPSRTHR